VPYARDPPFPAAGRPKPEVIAPVSMSAASRFRYTLAAGATAVVIGAGFTVVGLNRGGDDAPSPRAADAPLTVDAPPAGSGDAGGLLDNPASASATPSVSASPSAAPSSASPTPKVPAKKATSKPAKPKPRKTDSNDSKRDTPKDAPQTSGSILDQVLGHINAARTKNGLSAYTLNTNLSKASALHNQLMIGGCGLSHQCSGEDGIGGRFSAQGVQWNSAGENIGYGSSGGSDADIIKAANGLTDSMLAETPPNDGHRKNLLSTGFKRIGLSVVRDSKGITWMTQDFVN
jgi:uncharacterized protein YkwD